MKKISQQDYAQMIRQMEANRGHADDPKVGIFWYDSARKQLFGTVSRIILEYIRANATGWVSCSETHEAVLQEFLERQARHGDIEGPLYFFNEDYPKGRVFYQMDEDHFVVAVGKWIEDYPEAKDLILEEFDLPADKTTFELRY